MTRMSDDYSIARSMDESDAESSSCQEVSFPFIALPPEIRNWIYNLYLDDYRPDDDSEVRRHSFRHRRRLDFVDFGFHDGFSWTIKKSPITNSPPYGTFRPFSFFDTNDPDFIFTWIVNHPPPTLTLTSSQIFQEVQSLYLKDQLSLDLQFLLLGSSRFDKWLNQLGQSKVTRIRRLHVRSVYFDYVPPNPCHRRHSFEDLKLTIPAGDSQICIQSSVRPRNERLILRKILRRTVQGNTHEYTSADKRGSLTGEAIVQLLKRIVAHEARQRQLWMFAWEDVPDFFNSRLTYRGTWYNVAAVEVVDYDKILESIRLLWI